MKRLKLEDWLKLKPYHRKVSTDYYYLKIANKIRKEINTRNFPMAKFYLKDATLLNEFAIMMASYLEDVVSESKVWSTFLGVYRSKYDNSMPFFDPIEYEDDEVNWADVQFLTWYFFSLNMNNNITFLMPDMRELPEIAKKVFEILDAEFEYAPENDALKNFYFLEEGELSYYKMESKMRLFFFDSYLLYPDLGLAHFNYFAALLDAEGDYDLEHRLLVSQEKEDQFLHSSKSRLMGFAAREWLAAYLGKTHARYQDILDLSSRVSGVFYVAAEQEDQVVLKHVASEKTFELKKDRFNADFMETPKKGEYFTGHIVNYRNKWWITGNTFYQEPSELDLTKARNEKEALDSVAFLDQDALAVSRQALYDAFLRFNEGKPIAFIPANQLSEFVKGLKACKADPTSTKTISSFPSLTAASQQDFEVIHTLFVDPSNDYGLEKHEQLETLFDLPNNPYFDADESDLSLQSLIFISNCSQELLDYCIDLGKASLPAFKTDFGKWVLRDADFLRLFASGGWDRGYF